VRQMPAESSSTLPPLEPTSLPPAQTSLQAQQDETTARLLGMQAPAPAQRPASPRKANLRVFLDKLAHRRKKIECTAQCQKTIEASIRKLGGKQLKATGRVSLSQLKEVLRDPPKSVPSTTLREFVHVARSYDSMGDGCVNLQELLAGALHVQPALVQRLRWMLPLASLILWMLLGPAVYCSVAKWSFLDGLYFSVMTLTTVGTSGGLAAGGLVFPTTTGLKLFTAFYLLVGVALTTWLFVSVMISALLAHEARIWALLSPRDNADLLSDEGLGARKDGPPLEELAGFQPAMLQLSPEARQGVYDEEKGVRDETLSVSSRLQKSWLQTRLQSMRVWVAARAFKVTVAACVWTIVTVILAGTILALVTSDEASFVDAFCWAVLTSFTVGYGDMLPEVGDLMDTNVGRGLSIAFVLLAVSGVTGVMLKIGSLVLKGQSAKLETRIRARALPMDLLREMDADGRGVSRLEFLCAGLMASDCVSAHDLWLVLELFRRLDPEGTGVLGSSQLELLQRKGSDAQSTLELLSSIEVPGSGASPLKAVPARSFNFGSPSLSAVHPNFDLSSGSSEAGTRHRPSRLDEPSRGEVLAAASPSQQLVALAEPVAIEKTPPVKDDRSAAVLQEVYQDYSAVRRQLEARDAELVAALQAQSVSDQALAQATMQREALHKEVALLSQVKSELTEKLEQESKKRKNAEAILEELKTRCYSLEGKLQDAQRDRDEADRKSRSKVQLLTEAQERNKHLERRAQDAEREAADGARKLQEQAQHIKLQADARINEVRLLAAEVDLQRQGEMQSALLELQALSAGQQALRREVHEGRRILGLSQANLSDSLGSVAPARLSTGMQPWEVWERSLPPPLPREPPPPPREPVRDPGLTLLRPQTGLLLSSDKVRTQAEFLDSEVKRLNDRRPPRP